MENNFKIKINENGGINVKDGMGFINDYDRPEGQQAVRVFAKSATGFSCNCPTPPNIIGLSLINDQDCQLLSEGCCTYNAILIKGQVKWDLANICEGYTFLDCPSSNDITPPPTMLGETTSRAAVVPPPLPTPRPPTFEELQALIAFECGRKVMSGCAPQTYGEGQPCEQQYQPYVCNNGTMSLVNLYLMNNCGSWSAQAGKCVPSTNVGGQSVTDFIP